MERNEGDLETYEEPVRGGVQRKLALISKELGGKYTFELNTNFSISLLL